MPHTPRLALPLLAVLCAALAACSGDVGAPASPTASPSVADTPAASTPAPSPSASASASPAPSPTATVPDPEEEAETPEALAERLVAAERAIRDPGTDDADLRTWAHVQHAAYRTLAYRPDWVEPVAAAVPDELQAAFEANLHAQQELFALTTPRESLPDWRIVEPPPADELLEAYRAAGEEFGIDWTYLAAIHLTESRMGRIRGISDAGAQGPMQFLPSTWEDFGEGDIQDPHDAIRAAARYLAAHGAPDDMDGAIWAYNHSDHYVEAIQAYASVMRADPAAYDAYYHWRVHYRLQSGDVVLEEGWTHS